MAEGVTSTRVPLNTVSRGLAGIADEGAYMQIIGALSEFTQKYDSDPKYYIKLKNSTLKSFQSCLTTITPEAIKAHNDEMKSIGAANIVPMLDLEHKITNNPNMVRQRIELSKPTPACVKCAASGSVLIRYNLQGLNAEEVPIGHVQIQLIPIEVVYDNMGDGISLPRDVEAKISEIEKKSYLYMLDDKGEVLVDWSESKFQKYQRYKVIVIPVKSSDVTAWMSSYKGVIDKLHAELEQRWTEELLPEWDSFIKLNNEDFQLDDIEVYFNAGQVSTVTSSIESVKNAWQSFEEWDFRKWLDDLFKDEVKSTEPILKVLQDEVLFYIVTYYAQCWRNLLPPNQKMFFAGQRYAELILSVTVLVVQIIAGEIVLAGIFKGLSLAMGAIRSTGNLLKSTESMMAGLQTSLTAEANSIAVIGGQTVTIAAPSGGGILTISRKLKQMINVVEDNARKIKSALPKNKSSAPNKSSGPVSGDPISMATGEELLNFDDARFISQLPFTWTRFYRTSAAESNQGLGFGWSHALSHSLIFSGDEVIWSDDESQLTSFPLPTVTMPVIVNPVSESVIYLGKNEGEYHLAKSDGAGLYSFQRDGDIARLISISDKYGHRLTLIYDSHQRIVALQEESDETHRLYFSYSENEQQSELINAVVLQERSLNGEWQHQQVLMEYSYNTLNQMTSAINAVKEIEYYQYDQLNVIQKRTMAGGAEFNWAWDGEGKHARCLHQWANFAQLDEYYHWDNESVTVTMADGSKKSYAHQGGMLLSETAPDGAVTQYRYNDDGLKIAEIDGMGNETHFSYTPGGELASIVYPDGQVERYVWRNGYLVRRERNHQVWRMHRNELGDITQEESPEGLITRYTYNQHGQKIQADYPDNSHQYWVWGDRGELLEERESDGRLRQYCYDNLLRILSQTDELGQITTYQYDPVGRLLSVTFPDLRSREYQYNAYGKVTRLKDEAGRYTYYEYDKPLHLLTKKTLPDGSCLKYRYDNIHLQASEIENQKGEIYRIGYSAKGLVSEEIGFDNVKTTYGYDLNGKLVEKREFGDQHLEEPLVTRYLRDVAGRLLGRILPDGRKEQFQYDIQGNLTEVQEGELVLAWEYDATGRLTAEHQNWATLRHRYDKTTGNLSGTCLPDGQWLEYHHRDGQLRGMTLDGQPLAAFNYNNSGREGERRQGNGLINRFQYDGLGRLSRHQLRQGDGFEDNPLTLWQQDYHYQADGELSRVVGHNAKDYHYDAVGRLTSTEQPQHHPDAHHAHHTEVFEYDATGNRVSQSSTASGNRLAFYGDRHFEYDRFGNLIAERRGKELKVLTTFEYDCRHRLIKHTSPNGRVSIYTYDAFNRRTSKTIDGKTTEFIWQGNKLIAETDNAQHWRSYIYEADSFRPLAMVVGDASVSDKVKTYWYQNDHLGTPHSLTESLGEVVYSCSYNAYGKVVEDKHHQQERGGIRVDNPLRFQGQYYDEESGLHYNFNRYYDPGIGRYLTQDPLGLAGGENFYQYCPNPISWIDPLGLVPGMRPTGAGMSSYDVAADAAYAEIRLSGMSDIPTVARNSGLSVEEVTTMKKHLFFGRHEYPVGLGDKATLTRGRFEADSEIAYAWKTAQQKELTEAQKQWFKQLAAHELGERVMMSKGYPYRRVEAWNPKMERFETIPSGAHDLAPRGPVDIFPGYKYKL